MTAISSFLTFPCISWWARVLDTDIVILDAAEHFQKMTGRNRYDIAGANNPIKLSVPLVNGRNQHIAMCDAQVYNGAHWQVQHWRTLVSVYKRSPYFDHYAVSLQPLFETEFTHLAAFNRATVEWVKKQLKLKFEVQETTVYIKDYPADVRDLRNFKPRATLLPKYYQVFEDRVGFLPDLSILDLLFSEGPVAKSKLMG